MLNYFLHTIRQLRQEETVTLYEVWSPQRQYNDAEIVRFLEQSYQSESINYPFDAPAFNPAAALWGAHTMYIASQFLINRSLSTKNMQKYLPDFPDVATSACILSADLTLRFLPDIFQELKVIDSDDSLIGILEQRLTRWHYSGIRADLAPDTLDFSVVITDPCLYQLYLNRVILYKKNKLAIHPALQIGIWHNLGAHADILWPDLPLPL